MKVKIIITFILFVSFLHSQTLQTKSENYLIDSDFNKYVRKIPSQGITSINHKKYLNQIVFDTISINNKIFNDTSKVFNSIFNASHSIYARVFLEKPIAYYELKTGNCNLNINNSCDISIWLSIDSAQHFLLENLNIDCLLNDSCITSFEFEILNTENKEKWQKQKIFEYHLENLKLGEHFINCEIFGGTSNYNTDSRTNKPLAIGKFKYMKMADLPKNIDFPNLIEDKSSDAESKLEILTTIQNYAVKRNWKKQIDAVKISSNWLDIQNDYGKYLGRKRRFYAHFIHPDKHCSYNEFVICEDTINNKKNVEICGIIESKNCTCSNKKTTK